VALHLRPPRRGGGGSRPTWRGPHGGRRAAPPPPEKPSDALDAPPPDPQCTSWSGPCRCAPASPDPPRAEMERGKGGWRRRGRRRSSIRGRELVVVDPRASRRAGGEREGRGRRTPQSHAASPRQGGISGERRGEGCGWEGGGGEEREGESMTSGSRVWVVWMKERNKG
jgi:hypothetical protein